MSPRRPPRRRRPVPGAARRSTPARLPRSATTRAWPRPSRASAAPHRAGRRGRWPPCRARRSRPNPGRRAAPPAPGRWPWRVARPRRVSHATIGSRARLASTPTTIGMSKVAANLTKASAASTRAPTTRGSTLPRPPPSACLHNRDVPPADHRGRGHRNSRRYAVSARSRSSPSAANGGISAPGLRWFGCRSHASRSSPPGRLAAEARL